MALEECRSVRFRVLRKLDMVSGTMFFPTLLEIWAVWRLPTAMTALRTCFYGQGRLSTSATNLCGGGPGGVVPTIYCTGRWPCILGRGRDWGVRGADEFLDIFA